MLSMHSEETLVRQALDAGARGYILKNALDLDLAAAVKRVAAGETVLDPGGRAAGAAAGRAHARLTPRELEVLQLICDGLSNREIAAKLDAQRQHRRRAPRQHHERARRAQDRRARGLRDPARPGEPAVNRRDFLRVRRRAASAPRAAGAIAPTRRHRRRRASGSSTSPPRPGLGFRHNSGAYGGKLLPETLGSGCAFLDYDADGWQDILLVNGMDWPGHKRQRSTLRLYRNNRNGTFTDVTRAAGLDVELYGMGVAVGDFNNDGFPDLLVTCVGQNRLFRNTGKGTFVDVTRASGLGGRAGVQHVGDVGRLRSRRPARSVRLQLRQVVGRARRVLQPRRQAEVVLHARGLPRRHLLAVPQPRQRHVRGRHRDVRHLRLELEVARRRAARSRPGRLARHLRRQRHAAEQAVSQPAQRHVQGRRRSRRAWRSATTARRAPAWASTPRDFDNSGRAGPRDHQLRQRDDRALPARRRRASTRTSRRAPASAPPSRNTLGFGCVFADLDLDGALDLVVANGHIDDTVRNIRGNVGYAQPPQLFLNQGNGTFRDVASAVGGGVRAAARRPRAGLRRLRSRRRRRPAA